MSGRWWRAMLIVNLVLVVGLLLARAGSNQSDTLAAGSSATTLSTRPTQSSVLAPDTIPLLDTPTIAQPLGGTGPAPTGFRGFTTRSTFLTARHTNRFVTQTTRPMGTATASPPTTRRSFPQSPPTTRRPPSNGGGNSCDDPIFRKYSGQCAPPPTTSPPTTAPPTTAPPTTAPPTTEAPTTTAPPTTDPPTTDPPTTDPPDTTP